MTQTHRLRPGRPLVTGACGLIRFYQRFISVCFPRRCRYHPTCSAYAFSALKRFGILKGGALAVFRLLRCNPLSHGGYDPVPPVGTKLLKR